MAANNRPESNMLAYSIENNNTVGYKLGKNNAGIIGCLQALAIKELLGTIIAEYNEIIICDQICQNHILLGTFYTACFFQA